MLSRRAFLTQSAALAAGASVGGYPAIAPAQQSSGGWGDLSELLPGAKSYKVLEIHLHGGLSPWETFYVRLGRGLDWRGFDAKVNATAWPHAGSDDQQNLCRFSSRSGTRTMPFDTTHADHHIHLGPATAPLWRDDILKRMRVVVLQHDLLPHEAAIPYAATGLRLGRPQMAGMGAAVQARRKAIDPDGKAPAAYVCLSDPAASMDSMPAFWSSGMLGGGARPVVLRIGGGDQFVQRLERENAKDGNSTERFDNLLTAYRNAYDGMMQSPLMAPNGHPIPIRSKGFVEYDAALRMLKNAKELHTVLTGSGLGLFENINDGGCVRLGDGGALAPVTLNITRMSLTAAAALLRPPGNAGYACVIDSGLENAQGTAYDTHFNNHVEVTFTNLYNTLASLRSLIDLQLIDLDNTLIVLSTEFGRTPFKSDQGQPSAASDGRDHWPQGYTAALIGGPIAAIDPPDAPFNPGSAARVLGRIEDATGVAAARSVFTATDLRAAAVLAAGINPFTGDYINQGDLSKCMFPSSEESKFTLMRLRSTFFGDSWQPDTCPDPV